MSLSSLSEVPQYTFWNPLHKQMLTILLAPLMLLTIFGNVSIMKFLHSTTQITYNFQQSFVFLPQLLALQNHLSVRRLTGTRPGKLLIWFPISRKCLPSLVLFLEGPTVALMISMPKYVLSPSTYILPPLKLSLIALPPKGRISGTKIRA